MVVDGNKSLKVGIIEFDEDWFPFRFDPSEDYYESNDVRKDEFNEDSDNDEEISDTWMVDEDPEIEEGEIVHEEKNDTVEVGDVRKDLKNITKSFNSPLTCEGRAVVVDGIPTLDSYVDAGKLKN